MKTSKPPATASDAGPNRRQPMRQTRTNPPRSSATTGRTARDREAATVAQEQQIDIFPGVTHFADAITALPKELVKHFTLLKEVDAKINVPQQALFQLIHLALHQPVPNASHSAHDSSTTTSAPASAPMTTQNSSGGSGTFGLVGPNGHPTTQAHGPPSSSDLSLVNGSAYDKSDIMRRQLFRKVAIEIKEMLVALEEKNHVISTANDALNKQLGRIDDIWPHLEREFSDEAKWGSNTHWAYPENRAVSRATNNAQAERSRREGAASLSAAAQQIAEEAAARSDARKQAVAARRSQKTQSSNTHQDSDADDHHHKSEGKKSGGSKSRKTTVDKEAAAAAASGGLNISGAIAGTTNGITASSSKRRKVEKPAAGASVAMERALSGIYASNGGKTKTASPRESPAPDAAAKKRKALPAAGNAAKKSRNGASAASSPVISAFSDSLKSGIALPAPSAPVGSLFAESAVAEGFAKSPGHGGSMDGTGSTGGTVNPATDKSIDKPIEPASARWANAITNASGDGKPAAAASANGNSVTQSEIAGHVETNMGNTDVPEKMSGVAGNTGSPETNGVSKAATILSSAEPPGKDAKVAADTPAAGADPAPAEASTLNTASPEDQSAAQLNADDDDQQTPQPLAPLREKTTNGAAAPEHAALSPTTTHANALQTSVDKAMDEASISTVAETPVPVPDPISVSVPAPVPSSELTSKAAAATETAIPAPPIGNRNPLKVGALKSEAGESSPPVTAMTMTRTRSAGGHNHDAKREASLGSLTDANGKSDEVATKREAMLSNSVNAFQPPPVTTKSGRASKPSAPALATFADAMASSSSPSSTSRSRPVRAGELFSSSHNGGGSGSGTTKRSHKKGASSVSSQAARDRDHSYSHGHHHSASDVGNGSSSRSHQSQQGQQQRKHSAAEEEDEPLYCYCERVSFGEMIACDSDDCKREWFHLECVGLRVAPKTNVKWYCEDCKKRIKNGDRKSGGR